MSCEINVKKRDFVTISVEVKTILLQLVAAKNDFLTDAIVTLFLDIKYNITWLNRTEPEPELRFDEPNRTRTKPLLQWTEPNLNRGLMNRTRTWTEIWWTEPEPDQKFGSVRFNRNTIINYWISIDSKAFQSSEFCR